MLSTSPYRAISPKCYCKRFAQSARPLVSFSRILHYLGLIFTIPKALLKAFVQSWDHFWSTFGYMFRIMAPKVPQELLMKVKKMCKITKKPKMQKMCKWAAEHRSERPVCI